jgi:hypothetical protein
MAITAAFRLQAKQMDVVNAFTNSDLDETIYCECPKGFMIDGQCLLLLRALYGLQRSPLLWLQEFTQTLRDLQLRRVNEDVCLFTNEWLIVFFYVDDIVLLFQEKDSHKYAEFKKNLMNRYKIRDIGDLTWFLGIRVTRDFEQWKIWLCQDSYIEKIAQTFHIEYMKTPTTPLPFEELVPNEGKATS